MLNGSLNGLMSSVTLAAGNPVEHVINHKTVATESGWWLWSANQTNLVLSGIIVLVVGALAAREIKTGDEQDGHDRFLTRNPLAGMIEVISLFLREEIVRPLLHERTNRFMPFLWTLFYFILVNNLLGLVPLLDLWHLIMGEVTHTAPIGGTATQNLFVTAALAGVAFFVINIAGIRELGPWEYCKHLTGGAPWYVAILMVPIEILSTFIKPIALALRLFANMTAGHILVATLFMFVGMGLKAGIVIGSGVTLVSSVAAIAIYFLELFVAFLQAFVFMFLTAVFIGQLAHHGDHDEHDHEHAADDAGHAEPVPA
jgi:F-type H+-transporting ATPase subunit a